MKAAVRTYLYTFIFPNRNHLDFSISIDPVSLQITTCPVAAPEWAKLEYRQCLVCPLQNIENPFCPVALNIADLVTTFKTTASFMKCKVICVSAERTVSKDTTAQEGLASILGLLMAVSGCPIMDFFKPLARFHLPFSSVDESIFRIVATYLLRQYYRRDTGLGGDGLLLKEMKNHYALVKQVNKGILERIRSVTELDADQNAIVTLNSLGQILELEIDANLESLQHLFQ